MNDYKAIIDKAVDIFYNFMIKERFYISDSFKDQRNIYKEFNLLTEEELNYSIFYEKLVSEIESTLVLYIINDLLKMKGNNILLLENQSLADHDVYYSKLGLNLPYRDGDEKGRLNYEDNREIWSIIFENKEKEIVALKISTQNLERFKEDDLLGKHGISRVQLISLRDTNLFLKKSAISKFESCSDGELLEIYELENYFTDMFGSEVWEYYILQVKGIIQRVKQEVGFTVNGELNSKNLSYLKSTLKEIFRENEEIKLLDFFFNKKIYSALCGDEDFAKSFLTAEHLYRQANANSTIDYSIILTGYLKSLEQLLYLLVKKTMEISREDLWITCSNSTNLNKGNGNFRKKNRIINRKSKGRWQVKLIPECERYFEVSMGSLVYCLTDNAKAWRVSQSNIEKIRERLLNYAKKRRNKYFHKENLYDLSEVKEIRNETIKLLVLILGSYSISDSIEGDLKLLGARDFGFVEFYNKFIASSGNLNYKLVFRDGKEQTVLLSSSISNREERVYDKNGMLLSKLTFIKTKGFVSSINFGYQNFEEKAIQQDFITIDKDNYPLEVYQYDICAKDWKRIV
ncbi:hypothetical protein [Streptococcus sp. Marseille-Q3604]|uniref:hypothetical protein n=1 Tax=Streptococcus sp. Marseille-Q3604 TaxID=2866597 RepID=UPI001CE3E1E4|nr:hypothetical protein [Streptococcus sp. Marseille-Q3604]MBS7057203.1 hypothetical protein [Streptococcus salivarius]